MSSTRQKVQANYRFDVTELNCVDDMPGVGQFLYQLYSKGVAVGTMHRLHPTWIYRL